MGEEKRVNTPRRGQKVKGIRGLRYRRSQESVKGGGLDVVQRSKVRAEKKPLDFKIQRSLRTPGRTV